MKSGDYVVAIDSFNLIEKMAVGRISRVLEDGLIVLFIGANLELKVDKSKIAVIDITKTGKPYEKKICNVCHILKPMYEFDVNQTDAQGRKTTRPSCKVCRVDIDGEPMPVADRLRLNAIAPKDIFTCPICNKTSIVGITAKFVKDHDHITGQAREWICDSCNTGLGRFKDDYKLLQRAIAYLQKYHAHPFD